ncbi:MAG: hypothetical protein KME45_03295 [Stenomitos rutilans HA7619-LM2]|jgi:hypothetical protein|nr:hypothetical protein [Stenomitos rutilans HA7619-LM2]MBW4469410.1 hypothetical protein [Stenomitos rutilans HA7619-LM2]
MWFRFKKQQPKPPSIPKFDAIAHPALPVVYEAYGSIEALTPQLVHRLTIGRLSSATGYTRSLSPGKLLSQKILSTDGTREEDKVIWRSLLQGYPTHYLRFSYQLVSTPTAPAKELLHVWLNLNIRGFDKDSVARSVGEFLTFVVLDQKLPGLLVSTKIYTAESWLVFAFSRVRSFYVEAGIVQERAPLDSVRGYGLRGGKNG